MFKLKKIVSMCLIAVMTLCLAVTAHGATGGVKIVVDGKPLSTEGVIVNGRTLAPVRAIAEAMGATVEWNQQEKRIILSKIYWDSMGVKPEPDVRKVYMWIGKNKGTVSTFEFEMDVPPQIISGNTMIPVAAFGDALEAKVEWNQQTKTVAITSTLASTGEEAKHDALKQAVDLRNTTENYLKEVNDALINNELGMLVKDYGYNVLWNGHDVAMTYMYVEIQNSTQKNIPEHKLYLQMVNPLTKEVVESVPITVKELSAGERVEIVLDPAPSTYKELYKSVRLSPTE